MNQFESGSYYKFFCDFFLYTQLPLVILEMWRKLRLLEDDCLGKIWNGYLNSSILKHCYSSDISGYKSKPVIQVRSNKMKTSVDHIFVIDMFYEILIFC